jgi:hypothetical protein
MSKAAENLSAMHAVQWVCDYADLSAAEQMPGADASRGVSAALSASDDADSGRICHLRLHGNEVLQFYPLYANECRAGVEAHRYQDFVRVFNEDPRLKHISVTRKRDNFGVCTICTQYKQNLANHRLTKTEQEVFFHDFRCHLCGVAKDRAAMVARMAETKVLQPTEPDRTWGETNPPWCGGQIHRQNDERNY